MDWLDLLAVQGTLKSLLQHHSSKASILWRSAFFIVQLSHPYMTTGKTIALTKRTFVDKVMSLLFSMLSRLVITFLPGSKRLLYISVLLSIDSTLPKTFKHITCSIYSLFFEAVSDLFQSVPAAQLSSRDLSPFTITPFASLLSWIPIPGSHIFFYWFTP